MKTLLIKGKFVYRVNNHEFEEINKIMSNLRKAMRDEDEYQESHFFNLKISFEDRIQRTYRQPIMVIDYKV